MYITLLKISYKLVAHGTTEKHKDMEIDKMYLFLGCNDENIKKLLYF